MAVNNVLSAETATFNANKDRLLAEANGKYALVIGDEVVGTYVSERDALNEGYKRIGNKPFLVKKIVQFDSPVALPVSLS
ncbi:MAG TPA: hypothetical protein VNF08_04390 [Acidimicrobiales bacterium]|nr:hypothetical protein [Acidimicrobiales bacterium]